MLEHLENHQVKRCKKGWLNGCDLPDCEMVLVEAERPKGSGYEGKWVVLNCGQITLCAPALFEVLWRTTCKYLVGQTMEDGTMFTGPSTLELPQLHKPMITMMVKEETTSGGNNNNNGRSRNTTSKKRKGTSAPPGKQPDPKRYKPLDMEIVPTVVPTSGNMPDLTSFGKQDIKKELCL